MVRKDDLDFLRVLDGRLHSSEIVYYAGGPNVWGNKGLRHKFLEAKIKAAEIERLKEIVERNQDLAFGLSTVDYGFSPAYDILEKLEDAKITIRNTLMGDAEDCYVDVIDDLIKSLKEMM